MRLTIVRADNLIIKDGIGYYTDLSEFDDLTWIPDYDLKTWGRFHAFQWYGDIDEDGDYGNGGDQPYGEIEFKKPVPNLIVKELGVYNRAVSLWQTAKALDDARIAAEEAEAQRIREEQEAEEARIRDAYLELDMQNLLEMELDMENILADETQNQDDLALRLEEDLEKLLADL